MQISINNDHSQLIQLSPAFHLLVNTNKVFIYLIILCGDSVIFALTKCCYYPTLEEKCAKIWKQQDPIWWYIWRQVTLMTELINICSPLVEPNMFIRLRFTMSRSPCYQVPFNSSQIHSSKHRTQMLMCSWTNGGTSLRHSVMTNQRPVSRSRDHSRPIRGQYPVADVVVIWILCVSWPWMFPEQSKVHYRIVQYHHTLHSAWVVPVTNKRPVSGSRDLFRPMRGQYPVHLITLDQWEASIQVTWSLSTNERPVSLTLGS